MKLRVVQDNSPQFYFLLNNLIIKKIMKRIVFYKQNKSNAVTLKIDVLKNRTNYGQGVGPSIVPYLSRSKHVILKTNPVFSSQFFAIFAEIPLPHSPP